MRDESRPRITDIKDFGPGGFKWITLRRLQYVDQEGRERVWEAAERRTRSGSVDAVAILAKVFSKSSPEKIILVSQFRPPQGQFVIEFPAGLIDDGELASQSAVRELKEETGYSGRVMEESPIIYSDPGLTSSNFQMVTIHIDADAEQNREVNPELEEGEFVETLLLPVAGLYHKLLDLQKERKCDLDARLLLYAQGLYHAGQSGPAATDMPAPQIPPDNSLDTPSQAIPSQPSASLDSRPDNSNAEPSCEPQLSSRPSESVKADAKAAGHSASAMQSDSPDAAGANASSIGDQAAAELNQADESASQSSAEAGQAMPVPAVPLSQASGSDERQQPQKPLPRADSQAKQPSAREGQGKPPSAEKNVARSSFKPAGLRPLPARPGSKGMASAGPGKAAASGAAGSPGDQKKAAPSMGRRAPVISNKAAAGQAPQQSADISKAKWGIEPAPLKANGKKQVPSSDDSDFWKESSSDASGAWGFSKTWLVAGVGAAAGTLATLAITAMVSSRRGSLLDCPGLHLQPANGIWMAQGAGTEGFITQDDTEAVLKKVMDDGSFDKMRHKVIDQIKQNKDIVSRSEQLVRSSKALSAPGAGARTKKDLFDAIRRELEEEVLNEAVKAAWEILTTSTRCGGDPASAMTLRSAGESWVSPETSEQDTSPLHPTTSS
ncbi:hypothetical protein WJX74_002460 [Apatococcus lobatus]|uniref:Nudix hydrolase domain-containing protein n=1 Tax=Apatococcus lobatus TaxID=904363 RepID=A0AAW1QXH5_9CHLO